MYLVADDDPVLTSGGKPELSHEVTVPVYFVRRFNQKALAN